MLKISRFILNVTYRINCLRTVSSNMSSKVVVEGIVTKAINAVMPATLIRSRIEYCSMKSVLSIEGKDFVLEKNVILIGFGKAVLGMAEELHKLIGDHIVKGILSAPVGAVQQLRASSNHATLLDNNKIRIYEGALNNLPDESSHFAAKEIFDACCQADAEKLIITLVSGGGSALLCLPTDGINIQEKRQAVARLSKAGADIKELNTIRQAISKVKGGGLADCSYPAKMMSLVISDIIGDPIELIASGPTILPEKSIDDCLKTVVTKYKDTIDAFPESVQLQLSRYTNNSQSLVEPNDSINHFVIGNNARALEAASLAVKEFGYKPIIVSHSVEGNVRDVGKCFANLAKATWEILRHGKLITIDQSLMRIPFFCQSFETYITQLSEAAAVEGNRKICLLSGGEPTVLVQGGGVGGRNQELCLHFTKYCSKLLNVPKGEVTFVSFGTDGQDGPTDAAGAVVDVNTWQDIVNSGLNPEDYLIRNDSNTLLAKFNEGRNLIQTGLTGTNVMDIQVLLFDLK